jgi:hypothetical protein
VNVRTIGADRPPSYPSVRRQHARTAPGIGGRDVCVRLADFYSYVIRIVDVPIALAPERNGAVERTVVCVDVWTAGVALAPCGRIVIPTVNVACRVAAVHVDAAGARSVAAKTTAMSARFVMWFKNQMAVRKERTKLR